MRLRALCTTSAAFALALAGPAAPALAHEGGDVDKVVMKRVTAPQTEGVGTKMTPVANLQYALPKNGASSQSGSDIEFGRIGGRDYAFAGTLRNGMQIIDITTPTRPKLTAVYDCRVTQGDVQVFRQGSRVLAAYTADSAINTATGTANPSPTPIDRTDSACVQEARKKGFDVQGTDLGTFLVDVTNPAQPTTVSFMPVPRGSHNMTVHPSGGFLYNSNSDLISSTAPAITIFDIRNPAKPVKVQDFRIPFVPASLGSESHDITFSADGKRAYSAALSQTLVLDTTNPAQPKQISQIVDPSVQVSHGADPITLTRKDGSKRTLLVVSDEQAGAATGTNCPGGGLHFYDITGTLEAAPAKLATWFIGETKPSTATCTAHVFRMHGEQGLITVAWYDQGVRVLDVAGLADATGSRTTVLRGTQGGIKEIGSYVFTDSNTWSFKTNKIAKDGSFFGFGNDLGRGFDVYRFDGLGRTVPPLVPTELKAATTTRSELLPFLPAGPSGGLLAGLAALVALSANVALVRRAGRFATA